MIEQDKAKQNKQIQGKTRQDNTGEKGRKGRKRSKKNSRPSQENRIALVESKSRLQYKTAASRNQKDE
jgi:hypothetical protein